MFQIPIIKSAKPDSLLFAAEFSPQGVAVAVVDSGISPPRLLHCDFLEVAGAPGQAEKLRAYVVRHGLQGMACTVVLHPTQYQLVFVDRPEEVPDSELAEALRWRIKDLVQIPATEAVLDVVMLPDDAFRGRMNMVYVVVAHQKTIRERVSTIASCGLELKYIDVSEMALRNLGLLVSDRQRGFAVVRIEDDSGTVNVMEQDFLYLSRRIESGLATLQPAEQEPAEVDPNFAFMQMATDPGEALLLELQRSLDYYESQLGKGSVGSVYFSPVKESMPLDFLEERLGIPVKLMNLQELMTMEEPCPLYVQQLCCRAIGGALRRGDLT